MKNDLVAATSDNSPVEATGVDETFAPDWNLVHFAVGCARCGHDLRGLSDAKCPACDLAFDWADAVPLEELTCEHCGYHLYGLSETRCPECGNGFTWDEALRAYHRRRIPLFEYQWRRRPVRSLLRSWWLSLRPWKLWREIDIHDPPVTGALLLLVALSAAVCLVMPFVVGQFIAWVITVGTSGRVRSFFNDVNFFKVLSEWLPVGGDAYWFTEVWCLSLFGSLLVFQQSMRACRVRLVHVFRIWVYSLQVLAIAQLFCCMLLILGGIDFYLHWPGPGRGLWGSQGVQSAGWLGWFYAGLPFFFSCLLGLLIPLVWLWTFLSLGLAYRRYIRMKHAWFVVLASHAIALMIALMFLILSTGAPLVGLGADS